MTLVLSLVTPDFVLQVSDRRLTNPFDANFKPIDTANKSVLFCNLMTFAYTGLASINGKAVDDYLVTTIEEQDSCHPVVVSQYLASRLTQSFRALVLPRKYKRQTFGAVGWMYVPMKSWVPIIVQISNCRHRGRWLGEAQEEFEMQFAAFCVANRPKWGWFHIGASLTHDEKSSLQFAIKTYSKSWNRADPVSIALLFMDVMRRVAEREATVGTELLATVIPRQTAGLFAMSWLKGSTTLDDASKSSADQPAATTTIGKLAEYDNSMKPFGPAVVCPRSKVLVSVD
jgi:hypothetical protein